MMIHLVLVLLLATTCGGSLVSPLDRGVMGKISKKFLQHFADEVVDKTSTLLKGKSFSGSTSGSGYDFNYWGVRVNSINISPTINLQNDGSPRGGTGQLVVDGSIGGSIRASGSWRYEKSSWWYSINLSGGVDVSSSGFSIGNRVILGNKANGRGGFTHDPSACKASVGSLSIDITGSWYSWILNIVIWVFEDDLKAKLEEFTCENANNVVGEATRNFDDAMFNQDFSLPLKKGGELKVDFNPSAITGGPTCAVIATPAIIELTGRPTIPEIVTPPFIHIPATEEPIREKRQARDWCRAVPGPENGISVIVTEDMVSRVIENLHHFGLLKFSLVESGSVGSNKRFDVSRNGHKIQTINVEFPGIEGQDLVDFTGMTVKISSTAPPEVHITNSGISVNVNLRARVTVQSDSPKLEIRMEFQSMTDWRGTVRLIKREERYCLVPHITATVDVWTGKLYIGAHKDGMRRSDQRRLNEGNMILESIERLLNTMLEENLSKMLEEDVRSGIPLNIPSEYLTIGNAGITYQEDYILVSASDIRINLQ